MLVKLELLAALQDKVRIRERNAIDRYYPDDGPLRRELYPKHMAFFAAGVSERERLMIAANRVGKCLTINSLVDTQEGRKSIKELMLDGKKFNVRSWDVKKRKEVMAKSSVPFEKPGLHDCYRITMLDGQWVECADHHRILTSGGWRTISECLHLFGLPRKDSSLESCQTIRGANDVRSTETLEDCLYDYSAGFRLCDEPLHIFQDICQDAPLQSADVQRHNFVSFCLGGRENINTRNLLRSFCHLSNKNVPLRFLAQFAGYLSRAFYTNVVLLFGLFLKFLKPVFASFFAAQSSQILDLDTNDTLPSPCDYPIVIDANSIVSCVYIGRHKVYDFTVDETHCYIAGSLIHHNTEGVGLYELALHLTGDYPDWWQGRRFGRGVKAWVAGDTRQTVREILQTKLLGRPGNFGTGLIRGEKIARVVRGGGGVADSIDTVYVRHSSGDDSMVTFKSYDQRRESFQGTEQDIIMLDEEPPQNIYTECVMRTMTNNGMVMMTFTPLMGMTQLVMDFIASGKYMVTATWDDVPHLSEEVKKEMLASMPPHQRDARSKGVPLLGAGAIYPVPEEDIVINDMEIPKHWARCYGLDVGWNRTAAVWGALDRDADTLYLYAEHYRGQAEPSTHAEAIKARGSWIPGVIDPASNGSSQDDCVRIMQTYKDLGLDIAPAFNGVESGIYGVWERLSTGRLKVFKSLQNWLTEYRMYRRDEKGKIVKSNDHLMDATRYLVMSGLSRAANDQKKSDNGAYFNRMGGGSWMS